MRIFIFLLVFALSFSSALEEVPHTVEVITTRGEGVFPVSFFNEGEASTFNARLEKQTSVISLETNSLNVGNNDFGTFNLKINNEDIEKGVYFNTLILSKEEKDFQNIPVIVGIESKNSEIEYDLSIDFDPALDIEQSSDLILSPKINLYRLDYSNPSSESVSLQFSIYNMEGQVLTTTSEIVSVSRQASFEHFFNLGPDAPDEVLIVVSARRDNSYGLDLAQVSLSKELLLSPGDGNTISLKTYTSIFTFLIASIMLISYLWYNRSINQAKDWRSQMYHLKRTYFSDAAKGLRKLRAQKDVLKRAYFSRYISKESFDSAMSEIDSMSDELKKRL